ncbi:MAG: hypothetical protein RI947_555 [Candidatus Parcubacteria bacterium]
MKSRINLFQKRQRQDSWLFTENTKLYSTIIGVVLFIVFMSFVWLQFRLQSQIVMLQEQKKGLLQSLIENKDIEAKINYFAAKDDQLKLYLKDDAEFLPYYNLLKDILAFSSESPILESMTLDKNKSTEFVVRFVQYAPAYEFLKFIESDSFLTHFTELRLNNFSLTQDSTNSEQGYQLRFRGKFKIINANPS